MIGADAAILSPVFPTDSHPGRAALGTVKFTRLVGRAPLPVFALGGISAQNVNQIRTSGSVGIAGISGLIA